MFYLINLFLWFIDFFLWLQYSSNGNILDIPYFSLDSLLRWTLSQWVHGLNHSFQVFIDEHDEIAFATSVCFHLLKVNRYIFFFSNFSSLLAPKIKDGDCQNGKVKVSECCKNKCVVTGTTSPPVLLTFMENRKKKPWRKTKLHQHVIHKKFI